MLYYMFHVQLFLRSHPVPHKDKTVSILKLSSASAFSFQRTQSVKISIGSIKYLYVTSLVTTTTGI